MGRTSDYLGDNPVRLNLVMRRGVPVGIMRGWTASSTTERPTPARYVAHRPTRQ